jgi:hypothetical protein
LLVEFENVDYRATCEHKILCSALRVLEVANGKVVMKRMQVCDWLKRFRDGRASVEDDSLCGQQSTSTND